MGLFGKDKTARDLLADLSFRLQHDLIVTKLPFLACRSLQYWVSMYVWWREFLTAMARNASNNVARQYTDHAYDDQRDSTPKDCYDYGPRDKGITVG